MATVMNPAAITTSREKKNHGALDCSSGPSSWRKIRHTTKTGTVKTVRCDSAL